MERLDISVRRQLVKDDADWLGKPFDLAGNTPRAVQANTRHMALMLLDTTIKDRASRAAAFAEDLLNTSMAHHVTAPVACAKGCSHCCTTYVSTSLPEIFRLAQAVRAMPAAKARVIAAAARSKAMPQLQREVDRVICPILEDHACSAYAHRPLVCRAVLSTSLDSCVRIFQQNVAEQFAFPDNLSTVRSYLVIMVRAALVLAGLPHQNFELTHALEVALSSDDSEERWLAGEPLFAAVAIDHADSAQSRLMSLVNALAGAVRPTI